MRRLRSYALVTLLFLLSFTLFSAQKAQAQTIGWNPAVGANPIWAFEDTGVGSDSVTATIFLSRTNVVPFTDPIIDSVTLADTANFSMEESCTGASLQSLGPDSYCTINLQFNPTADGPFMTTVTVISSNSTNSFGTGAMAGEFIFEITGNGIVGPNAAIVPNPVSFGMQAVGSTSAAQIIEVRSNGTTPLENIVVTALSGGTDFSILQDNCNGATLPVGASCLIQAVFSPTTTGALADSFDVSADDGVGPTTVDLDGTGFEGPGISVLPSSLLLDFPDTGVGWTSAPLILEIHSVGTTDLENIDVPDPVVPEFVKTQDNCSGETLAPGSSCLVQFTFTPSDVTNFSDTIMVTADNVSATDVDLDGDGINGPAIDVVPNPVSFGMQFVGTISAAQIVEVRSTGTAPISITSVGPLVTGTDFTITQDNCTGATVQPGGNCNLQVVFNPTAVGALADSFDVVESTLGATTVDVDGTGIQSGISSTGSGAFGNVNVGSVGGPNTFTITNTSADANLEIHGLQQIGDDTNQFSLRNDNCSYQTLAPGADCTFQAAFNPHAGGVFTDTVLIPNNSDTPSFTVNLTGTGILVGVAQAQIKPDVLDFDLETETSNTQSATVTNIGDEALNITDLMFTGDNGFTSTDDCTGATLASGDSCTITVTFTAGVTVGNFKGTIMVNSNGAQQAFLVLLGSVSEDELGGGGCAIQGNALPGAPTLWLAFGLVLAAGLFRLRIKTRA